MLMSLDTCQWDDGALKYGFNGAAEAENVLILGDRFFGLKENCLPRITASTGMLSRISGGSLDGVPIGGV